MAIAKWPRPGVARVASFPDGSTCKESSPGPEGVVSRVVDPPFGYWEANAWAEGRARMMGGDAARTELGPDGPSEDPAKDRGPGRFGPIPYGYVLTYLHALLPGWAVIDDMTMLSTGEVDNSDDGPYSAVLNAWETMGAAPGSTPS